MGVNALILESNLVTRECLRRVIEDSFCGEARVEEVATGPEALARVRSAASSGKPVDLLLVDMEHPDGDWPGLLRACRADVLVRVVCTLNADDDQLFKAMAAGADGHLRKDARFEVLVEHLQRVARGMPPLTPGLARRMVAALGAGQQSAVQMLSERESAVLTALGRGLTVREVARQQGVRGPTLYSPLRSACRKLAMADVSEGAVQASG